MNVKTSVVRISGVVIVGLLSALAGLPEKPVGAAPNQFYVSPSGSSGNDGSEARPLDLATALSSRSPAKPGDTIWLRGGTYRGAFTSVLTGLPSAPIIVRQYPGERATIDASSRTQSALTVQGADTWYWGFEVTDSYPTRTTTNSTYTSGLRATSVWVLGPRTKFINMIVHDGEQGFGFWGAAVDAEIYGSVIYNVGVDNASKGDGHSIYVQSPIGTKKITDNILFNSFSMGVHAYTVGGRIDNIQMEGNIAFNHGVLSASSGAKANFYMGGEDDPDYPVYRNNYSYFSPEYSRGRNIEIRPSCHNGTFTGNYFAGGTAAIIYCSTAVVTGNVFAGPTTFGTPYPNNTLITGRPTGTHVFVRPNRYEAGRANIAIYNWALASAVSVDLKAAGLSVGQAFEIRDAQNFFGPPVVTGQYNGAAVQVPMTALVAARPVGNAPVIPDHTGPEFGTFVVLPTDAVAPPTSPQTPEEPAPNQPPAVTLTAPVATASFTAPATVSFSANATDPDGKVAKVEYFSGTTRLGTATVPPYTAVVTNVPAGTHQMSARATDLLGASKDSTAVAVTVKSTETAPLPPPPVASPSPSTANVAPVVTLTSPLSPIKMNAPASVTVTATASDRDGTIARVEFYNNGGKIGEARSAPYTFTLSNIKSGSQSFRARAFDNLGASTWSTVAYVTVRIPPGVRLLTPTATDRLVALQPISLAAVAATYEGTIAKVEYFNGSVKIGESVKAPYYVTVWPSVPAGTYTLTARAWDSFGGTNLSMPVTITVR